MSPRRLAAVFALALAACEPEPVPEGCAWPESPSAPTGVVEDTCGWYLLEVGQHLYVNVYVTEPQSPCAGTFGGGLEVPDPIYSDMADDGPKWTFDVLAQVPGNELPVEITCDEGTFLELKVNVE